MAKIHLPPELRWKTVQYKHQLKPAASIWTYGTFADMYQEPKEEEIVALNSKRHADFFLDDHSQMVIGKPGKQGAIISTGHLSYSEWNIGPDPVLDTNWYISLKEDDAWEVYNFLCFMLRVLG